MLILKKIILIGYQLVSHRDEFNFVKMGLDHIELNPSY